MIALFIKAGYIIFKSELGVRLLVVLAATAVLLIIEAILPRKDDPLFYAIACSMAVLQLGSFMALPDIPLMLFTALFFLIYRQYLRRADFLTTILMGLVIALMMYSKYQSVLIVFFTLISNPRLLLKKQTYLVALIALACLLPHLNWQQKHGFISLQYQMERNSGNSYQFVYTLEYLIGQILFAGPFAGILLLWAAFTYQPRDLFEKSLKYTLAGTYGFFLLLTTEGRVEANWTLPAFVPLIILSYKYLQSKPVISRWLFRLTPITLVSVLALRIYMTLDVLPTNWIGKDEVHGTREWIQAIQEKAKGLPVVFLDSYQKSSRRAVLL
jgi:4-amino-4-deoxy-L-arabinose transferase-like glycosyltransferase